MNSHPLGTVAELWRYPVKSMRGERCESLLFETRGVTGDRQFAIRDAAGKFGSGKNTRRFRKIDGLLEFTTRYCGNVPEIRFPSGEVVRGDSPSIDGAHVRYFYDSGEFSDEYDLVIDKTGDIYKASWLAKGKLQAVGVGMEVDNGLAVGWRRVND